MTNERELCAIVAHGLLNTLAVLQGAAATLLQFDTSLSADDRETLVTAIETQAALFDDGLEVVMRSASQAFADAASTVVLLTNALRRAEPDDLRPILDGIVTKATALRSGLEAQVRALPAEVLELLDSLQR